jgi:cytochrome c
MPLRPDEKRRRVAVLAVALGAAAIAGAATREYRQQRHQLESRVAAMTGGDIARGRQLFQVYGCGACHSIGGVPQAQGQVGPPLEGLGARAVLAGKLSNNPANLRRWILDPQSVSPGTAMPRLGVRDQEARDLSAFIYSRR